MAGKYDNLPVVVPDSEDYSSLPLVVPNDDYRNLPIVVPDEKAVRIAERGPVEEFARHTAALPLRIASGIPSAVGGLTGLIGTAGRMALGDDAKTAFTKSMDNIFVNYGRSLRDATNTALDIEEPTSVAGQITNTFLENAIPVKGVIGGATSAATNLAAKALPNLSQKALADIGRTAEILTPIVTVDKARPIASAVSVGLQGGLGVGLDQAARAYVNDPVNLPTVVDAARKEGLINAPPPKEPTAPITGEPIDPQFNQEVAYSGLIDRYAPEVGTALAAAAALKYRHAVPTADRVLARINDKSVFGATIHQDARPPTFETKVRGLADQHAHLEGYVDQINGSVGAGNTRLTQIGQAPAYQKIVSDTEKQILDGRTGVDHTVISRNFVENGSLGDNMPVSPHKPKEVLRELQAMKEDGSIDLVNEYAGLVAELQNRVYAQVHTLVKNKHPEAARYLDLFENQGHDAALSAMRKDNNFFDPANPYGNTLPGANDAPATGTRVPGQNRVWYNSELPDAIAALKANPVVHGMVRKISDINRTLLESGADVIGRENVEKLIKQHTFDGEFIYIPRQENAGSTSLLDKIKSWTGWRNPDEAQPDIMRNLRERATTELGGVLQPLNVDEMAQTYINGMIKYLTHERLKGKIGRMIENQAWTDSSLQKMAYPIGRKLIHENTDIAAKIYDPLGVINRGIVNRTEAKNIINDPSRHFTYIRDGEMIVMAVEDKALRHAMEFNPQLATGALGVFETMRKFRQLTTTGGWWTGFAPISALYNTSMMMLTKDGLKFNPITDNYKGFVENFRSSMLRTWGNAFERLGQLSDAPGNHWDVMALAAKDRLGRTFSARMQEIGLGMRDRIDYDSDIHGLLNKNSAYVPYLADSRGKVFAKAAWDSLNNLSESIKASVKTGAMLRNVTGMSEEEILQVASQVAKAEGKMHAKSANPVIRMAAAAIPYGNVAVQSLAAIGSAFKRNPVGVTTGIGSVIVAPTLAEYMFTNLMASDEQKAFYNKIDATARSKAWHFPGFSGVANDWHVVPVMPEVSMFRAATQGAVETMFGQVGGEGAFNGNRDQWLAAQRGLARWLGMSNLPLLDLFMATHGQHMPEGLVGGIVPVNGDPNLGYDSGERDSETDFFSNYTKNMITAVAGALGKMGADIADAYSIGARAVDLERPDSALRGLSYAIDKAGEIAKSKIPGMLRYIPTGAHSTDLAKNVQKQDSAFSSIMDDVKAANAGMYLSDGSVSPIGALRVNDTQTYAVIRGLVEEFNGAIHEQTQQMSALNQRLSKLKSTNYDLSTGQAFDERPQQKSAVDNVLAEIADVYNAKAVLYRAMENRIYNQTGKELRIADLSPHNIKRTGAQQQSSKNLAP